MFEQRNRKTLYWICQLGGWSFFVLLNLALLQLSGSGNGEMYWGLLIIFISGIGLSQLLRNTILQFGWLNLNIARQAPLILISCIILGASLAGIQWLFDSLLHFGISNDEGSAARYLVNMLNFSFVFFFWSLFYFFVHYVVNYKRSEIENLRWQAGIREVELNKLKSQLNPHFMFNAMNSIRALVDENPAKAKDAVTQLSNLLRNSLQIGKNKLIPLEEELRIVRDYLSIESVRLEERLKISWQIESEAERMEVPPMMIQTLAENAIKHGIAQIPAGGELFIAAKPLNDGLEILIRNSGKYRPDIKPESGLGIANTLQRLELLYGSRAAFDIRQENDTTVITRLFIPKISSS